MCRMCYGFAAVLSKRISDSFLRFLIQDMIINLSGAYIGMTGKMLSYRYPTMRCRLASKEHEFLQDIMTTFSEENINCAISDFGITENVWRSTNTIGADLDMRPRGMERQVYVTSIMVCPNCNYCSTDISKSTDGSKRGDGNSGVSGIK